MTSITLDLPPGKQSKQYHNALSALIYNYDIEDIEDMLLAHHIKSNNPSEYMSFEDFKTSVGSS